MPSRTLLILAAAFCLAGGASHAACKVPDSASAMQAELLANLNAERAARSLPPLKLDTALDTAAQKHACDNAKRMTTSHVSGDGSKLQHRLRRVGYDYATAAENTGRGFASGKRAVEWWMNSPGHKKNMLMSGIKDIGIGIALSAEPDNRLHWIMVVGKSH
jgi:uncharacterized protein YkwD